MLSPKSPRRQIMWPCPALPLKNSNLASREDVSGQFDDMAGQAKLLIERFARYAVGASRAEIKRRVESANELAQKNKWKVEVTLEDKGIKNELIEEIVERKMKLLVGKQGEMLSTPAARHTIALYKRTGEASKSRPFVDPADDEDTPPFPPHRPLVSTTTPKRTGKMAPVYDVEYDFHPDGAAIPYLVEVDSSSAGSSPVLHHPSDLEDVDYWFRLEYADWESAVNKDPKTRDSSAPRPVARNKRSWNGRGEMEKRVKRQRLDLDGSFNTATWDTPVPENLLDKQAIHRKGTSNLTHKHNYRFWFLRATA
ncbi:hypothetical protein NEUTE2DRAFT_73994 [Neurospora tetrasperma FGSC 2509]|nr:hypothetical protein NEUTE2DRAFT_73994 [Neurospora tetrasperma FGSC 2509]